MNDYHESVMVDEAIEGLHIEKGRKYIDATLGTGGHSEEILKLGGKVLGIDLDPKMVEIAKDRLKNNPNFIGVHGSFTDIDKIAAENEWTQVSGILFDLGVSNIHLKDLKRGFSFGNPEADLDMRIDPDSQAIKASDLLNVLREDQLREMFEITLDPGSAKWITGRTLHSRDRKPISTVGDLLEITRGLRTAKKGLNEATLPFLALRIAVNSELDNLREAMPKAFDLLISDGRLVVISFHSKEDGIVKDFMSERVIEGRGKMITFRPVSAAESEIEANKKARSAKMRIIQKL